MSNLPINRTEADETIARLTRERDEALAELAATERCITPKTLETATRVAFEQRDKAERERDEMRKAFRRYAEHDADCPSGFPDPQACECGLSALLKATEVKP